MYVCLQKMKCFVILMLQNSMECSTPVRVIRGHVDQQNKYGGKFYTYDGLYNVSCQLYSLFLLLENLTSFKRFVQVLWISINANKCACTKLQPSVLCMCQSFIVIKTWTKSRHPSLGVGALTNITQGDNAVSFILGYIYVFKTIRPCN